MSEDILENATKSVNTTGAWYFNWYKRLPKVLRIIVQILLILTLVYYGIIILYKIWDGIGRILHWLTNRRNWWVYSTSILILIIGALVIMQLYAPYKPFTELYNWIISTLNNLKWW